MRPLLSATTAALLLLATGTTIAQQSNRSGLGAGPGANSTRGRPERGTNAAGSALLAGDEMFVEMAAQSGMLEIQSGKLAVQKARRCDKKDLARHLADEHAAANSRLETVAAKDGVSIGKDLTQENHARFLKLRDATPIDQAFLDEQQRAHQEAIALFSREAQDGQDAGHKDFAGDALPKLREHLAMIDQMRAAPTASGEAPQGAPSGSTSGAKR